MARIQIYRYLSDDFEQKEIKEGIALNEAFPDMDLTKRIILVNGLFEENAGYKVKKDDVIQIRSFPTDPVTATGLLIGGIVLAAGGVAIGLQVYKERVAAEEAVRQAEKLAKSLSSSTTDDILNVPYLKGSSNTIATGKTQPYIIGQHRFTPYILNAGGNNYKGFHSIEGEQGDKVFYNVVLEGGFNPQSINDIYAGDMKILGCAQTGAQEGIFGLTCSSSYASESSFVEFAQDGNAFETNNFNQKIVEKEHSDILYQGSNDNYKDLIYSLEDNAMGCDVEIMFNGLLHYGSNGAKETKSRTIKCYYSFDYNEKAADKSIDDPVSAATWTKFDSLWKATKVEGAGNVGHEGTYTYYIKGCKWCDRNSSGPYEITQAQAKAWAEADPSKWTFTGGEDVRNISGTSSIEYTSGCYGGTIGLFWWTQYEQYLVFKVRKVTYNAGTTTVVPSDTITGNFTKQVRFACSTAFNLTDLFEWVSSTNPTTGEEEYSWKRKSDYPVAVRLVSEDTESSSGQDVCDCYCEWIHSYCYNEDKTAAQESSATSFVQEKIIEEKEASQSTLIGLKIESTTENESGLGSIQVVTNGLAPTWDGSAWSVSWDGSSWTGTKYKTDNPASWFYEILTSDAHKPSKISASYIDTDSLGAWYDYCEEKGLHVNLVVTDGMVKSQLLSTILNCGRAVAYRSIYGKIAVAIDKPVDNAIAILNEQNIISLEYSKDMDRLPDGVKVSYINADNDYEEDSFVVMYDQYDEDGNFDPYGENRSADCILTELSATGMTTWIQAYRYALYTMRCAKLRPKKVTVSVGEEGIFYTPMAKILLQHPALKIGLGNAEIKAVVKNSDNEIVGLDLYDAVEMEEGKTYNVIIDCVSETYSTVLSKEIVTEAGRVKTITFSEAIASDATVVPHAGDILSYGYGVSTVTSPMLISEIEPNDSGYTLTLVDYNESIFDEGDQIKDYTPNLTQPQGSSSGVPSELPSASLEDLYGAVSGITEGTAEVGAPDVPVFTAYAVKDGITLTCEPFGEGLKNSIAKIMWYMKKEEDEDWTLLTSSGDKTYTYSFDRSTDGYPEKADFEGWLFKCVAYNGSGNHSESVETTVNTTKYGTWELTDPSVLSRVSDRTITLIMSESARSDTLETYGTIKYKVQVRKPSVDAEGTFYKPATSADPYTSEDNYKDGEGYVTSEGVYTQTMPLTGQSSDSIVDTAYQFQITAYNEVNESTAVVINATAVCTSIRDLVKANETAKESYIENLTALCSAFGFISGGLVDGKLTDALNYWALNSGLVDNDDNNRAYKGAFRVGGDDEFLLVKPVVTDGEVTGYSIDFKVGNFNVTSQASLFEGEFNVQDANSVLDRVKISPTGIFLQHRDSKAGAWYTVNQFDTSGVIAPSMRSNSQLIMGNFSQTVLRKAGHDIGRPYLTDEGVVYHFDDDIYNQNGTSGGMTLTGSYALKGAEDSAGIDFTPAIYAVAPYCTNAKCCYGQYSLDFPVSEATLLTVDFWEQYLYAEAQELFNIGTGNDKLKLEVLPSEPLAVTSGVCSWVYNVSNYLYTSKRNPSVGDYVYTSTSYAEIAGESDLTVEAVTLNEDYTVASITIGGNVYGFESGSAEMNWETFAPEEEWGEDSCIACRADNKKTLITHVGQASSEEIYLSDLDETFDEYEWEHIGVVFTDSKIKFLFNKASYEFTRYSTASADFDISLNGSKTSVILDEVYIDTAVELTADFIAQTSNRVPWAKLDKDKNWMIFDGADPSLFKSNVFDYKMSQMLNSDELKSVIQSVIDAQ